MTGVCCGAEQNAAGERGNTIPENRQRIEKTIRYMTENLGRTLQASDLAAMANMSLSHYFALFKRVTGCSPMAFFIRLRMKRACQLLETTSLNVKETASVLGYEDPFYFSRLFKSVAGISPTDYRKAHQGETGLNRGQARSDLVPEPAWKSVQHDRNVFTKRASSSPRPELLNIVQLPSTHL
jgi:AraC-like DNA-binding protein